LSETGVAPSAAMMIGDSTYDMEMACSAGVKAIGVAWGYHAPASLSGAGASYIAQDYSALAQMLR